MKQPALSAHLRVPLLAKEPRGSGQSRGAIPRMLSPSGLCFGAYDQRGTAGTRAYGSPGPGIVLILPVDPLISPLH